MTALAVPVAPEASVPRGGPTADPAWLRTCVDVFGLDARPFSVPGASAPLALVRGRLELIGTSILGEPTDLAWSDEEALDPLAAEIAAAGRPLRLFRLPSASPAIPALRRQLPLVLDRPAGRCPVLRLDDDPARLLSSRRRQDLRRARRAAARSWRVALQIHEPAPADVDALVELALAVEARSWKGRHGTALRLDRLRAPFYRAYCREAAASGTLRIALLELSGAPAAMQIAVERDGALWLLKIGYDERFAACSPGHLLMEETLRWAFERELERYELLGLAKPWTRLWTREEWPCSFVLGYPANPAGAGAALADSLRAVRSVARR